MLGPILLGAVAMVHGALFWSDFHGYAGWLARGMKDHRVWHYSLGEGRYRRTRPRWEIQATPGVRRFGGGWAIVVGVIAVIVGLTHH